MGKGAKIVIGISVFFIIILLIGVAGNMSRLPEQETRLQELYDACVDENDDIMSHEEAVATCDQIQSDADLFS